MNAKNASYLTLFLSLLLAGCLKPTAPLHVGGTGSGKSIGEQVLQRVMPGKNVIDDKNGKEIWFAYGAVTGTDLPSNGVATAHYLENGTYVLGIQLNIADPADGNYYESWLVGSDRASRISAGHFIAGRRGGQQVLRFETKKDLRKYLYLAVTKEKDDGNPLPSEEVATGDLRVTKR